MASAQGPSRLDCAKAATPIERAICAKPELAAADRKMAAAYAALAGKLTGAAKDHLLADQIRWLANRAAACVVDPAEMEECLESRDRDRTAQLEWLGEGAYPFISEQALVKSGKVRGIPYIIDASYPQFDAGAVDFSGVNRQLVSTTSEAADRVVPGPDADNDGGNYGGPAWRYEQAFTLYKPGPNAVSVKISYNAYEGGAHGIVGVAGMLVDLRTGKAVGPEGVFLPNSNWLRELTRIASADINTPNLPTSSSSRIATSSSRIAWSFPSISTKAAPTPSRFPTIGFAQCCASMARFHGRGHDEVDPWSFPPGCSTAGNTALRK